MRLKLAFYVLCAVCFGVGVLLSSAMRVNSQVRPGSAAPTETTAAVSLSTYSPSVGGTEGGTTEHGGPVLALQELVLGELDVRERERMAESLCVRCVSRGMQPKCRFRSLVVSEGGKLGVFGPDERSVGHYPNPIFPADGLVEPLWRYHRYKGHPIHYLGKACPCTHVVERPTVFLFRMSGHSTYHLWENNLGPFYSTLQDRELVGELQTELNDPRKLLVAYVDSKPRTGPKAPKLLNQLLQVFSDTKLINASSMKSHVCFRSAVVGISDHSFPHRSLLERMKTNFVGYSTVGPIPSEPNVTFISRNHRNVTRGRKIANEKEVVERLGAAVLQLTGRPLRYAHLEEYSYREQVDMMMHTQIMLSPHGGGIANCIWMEPNSVVVEFVAPVGRTLPSMYHTMCTKSGVKHFHFLADPDPADAGLTAEQLNNNPRLFSNMLVRPEVMVANFKKALKLYHERAGQH